MNGNSDVNLNSFSDNALIKRLADFVKWHRLNQNKTQEQVAKEAGISRSTLSLMEKGETISIACLIQVLRVLDVLYVFDVFKTQEQISPLAYVKLKKKQRKRASNTIKSSDPKNELEW